MLTSECSAQDDSLDPAQQAQQDQSGSAGGYRQGGPQSGASKVEEASERQQRRPQLQQEDSNPYRSLGALFVVPESLFYPNLDPAGFHPVCALPLFEPVGWMQATPWRGGGHS
jgi:hypothetical protein